MNYKHNTKDTLSEQASKGGESSQIVVSNQSGPAEAVQAKPLQVTVYGNNFDKALKAFRALVQKERILSVYKERQTYEKASDRKRRKRNESKRKQYQELHPPTTIKKKKFKHKPSSD